MRTEKALKNSVVAVGTNIVTIVFAFIIKKVFNDVLGAEYLGVSGLFSSLISGLCVIDIGFGNAIIYNMYKPVAENNIEQIKTLLNFYKKIYRVIALVMFLLGIVLLPFVEIIVGETSGNLNLKLIFILYIIDVVVSYLAVYKRSILYANQQIYIITLIHTVIIILTNLVQIAVLIVTGSFYIYLIVNIILRIIENLIINAIVNKKYPYVLDRVTQKLDEETISDIKRKVKGLMIHNLSTFLVLGTDNIIISMIPGLGVIMVGVYSAYSLVTSKLAAIVDSVFSSLTATVGNLIVSENSQKVYATFKNIFLINSWMYVFIAISFYYISFSFIEIWMGKSFVLDKITVFIITIKLFISGLRASFGCFKNAAGIFYEDRFVPIIESLINLVTSVPLGFIFGLKGVLLGTIISTMVIYVYTIPKFIYGKVFNMNLHTYIKDIAKVLLQFIVAFMLTSFFINKIELSTVWYSLIYRGIVCTIVPNIFMIGINFKTKEFEFVKKLINKLKIKLIKI